MVPEHPLCWGKRDPMGRLAWLHKLYCLVQVLLLNSSCPTLLPPSVRPFGLSFVLSSLSPSAVKSNFCFSRFPTQHPSFPLFCSSFWIPTPFLLFSPICHALPLVSPNSRDQQSLVPSPCPSATPCPTAGPSHSSSSPHSIP